MTSRRGRGWVAGLTAVVALALVVVLATLRPETVFEAEGPFGTVRVAEHPDGRRSLYIGDGRAVQSSVYPDDPGRLVLAYSRSAMAALALVPAGGQVLFVGLGGGAMPSYTRAVRPDVTVDVVEIDPVVAEVARRFFGFTPGPSMRVHLADGRAFIEAAAPDVWDAVFLDAFSDDEVPYALTTREFLEEVRRVLAPGGVVAGNIWTSPGVYPSMVATYRAVFAEVALVGVPGRRQVILLASPAAGRLERGSVVEAARRLADRAELGFDLPSLVAAQWGRPRAMDAPPLRDSTGQGR